MSSMGGCLLRKDCRGGLKWEVLVIGWGGGVPFKSPAAKKSEGGEDRILAAGYRRGAGKTLFFYYCTPRIHSQ